MLEIFAYKKWRKHKSDEALREAHAKEALSKQDEAFIRRSLSDDHEKAKPSFFKFGGKRTSEEKPTKEELDAINSKSGTNTPTSQEEDFARVLSALNLAVEKKTAFSLSDETRAMLKEFTQILKDIQSGAPHAKDDLIKFLNKFNDQLNSRFESIPGFMKALISAIPFPIARKLDKKSSKDVTADILKDLAKPGVIAGLLRNIMNVLRTRFPSFVGSNALLSLGLFVLLFGVWYCYKRGREERMKNGQSEQRVPEILVEGAKPQDDTDHGTGTSIPTPESRIPIVDTVNVLADTRSPANTEEVDDCPLQVESDQVPKKRRKSWLNRSSS